MNAWSDSETLAHELGPRDVAPAHTNTVPNIPADDLMMSPTASPGTLTVGQCFRANVNTNSVLNSLPVRSGPTPVVSGHHDQRHLSRAGHASLSEDA